MTKRFCDICGKEVIGLMELKIVENSKDYHFSISSNGRLWDICNECMEDLAVWIKDRKEHPVCQESQSQ